MKSNWDYPLLVKSLHDAREILSQCRRQLHFLTPEWNFLSHATGHIQSQDDLFRQMFYEVPEIPDKPETIEYTDPADYKPYGTFISTVSPYKSHK